ncbi:TPR repeat protein oca3 [Neolecta irregularis DAH-3]|uniref:ER membrane protein complex subunit 2 n=1 Tax=Neolecta irregularis (strain DAH-3) TaxID=1198029 RepID=A0A1U7LRF8_NEOID|nr:TPR repeat protein oca3 [Neolecta irregularis DAH-3]|eukprot:OLL25256.1 TPR repeat protein oca3 [Neolecta irregularis DAH-3]
MSLTLKELRCLSPTDLLSKTYQLTKNPSFLTRPEGYEILELIINAALLTSNNELANQCLARLTDRFPTSPRVKVLQGMTLEAQGKTLEALKFYEKCLEEDSTNIAIMKRKEAVFKSAGRTGDSIKLIISILDSFPTDSESWSELAELYISIDLMTQAAFCFEELIVLNPYSYSTFARYGEVVFLQGEYQDSLKAFLRSVELCNGYARGWYGVKMSISRLLDSKSESPEYFKLDLLATEQLLQLSKNADEEERIAIEKLVAKYYRNH